MEDKYSFEDLVQITGRLRADDGCPWDREQTHESLKVCMKEEAYEVIEAIENKDMDNLCEELGDVLLQVTMHAQIAKENNEFTLDDVVTGICEKLIRRHPHVFGQLEVADSSQVLDNWEDIKRAEKKEKTAIEGILRVPAALPACIRTQKIQKKAGKAGYTLDSTFACVNSMVQTLNNFNENDAENVIGELLFQIINIAEKSNVNAEDALISYTKKFVDQLEF